MYRFVDISIYYKSINTYDPQISSACTATLRGVHVSRFSSSLEYPQHMHRVGIRSVMLCGSRPDPSVRVGLARRGGTRAQAPT